MNKVLIIGSAVIIIVTGGVVGLVATHTSSGPSLHPTSKPSVSATTSNNDSTDGYDSNASGSRTTPSTNDSVNISNFAFGPSTVTVKKGTAVTWKNMDSAAHTVVEVDGKAGPQSSSLATGVTYSFTYDTVGTFKYHCSIHPDMLGTVVVTE